MVIYYLCEIVTGNVAENHGKMAENFSITLHDHTKRLPGLDSYRSKLKNTLKMKTSVISRTI
jgi:hypothetical protein